MLSLPLLLDLHWSLYPSPELALPAQPLEDLLSSHKEQKHNNRISPDPLYNRRRYGRHGCSEN